jgi:hypothetical protein
MRPEVEYPPENHGTKLLGAYKFTSYPSRVSEGRVGVIIHSKELTLKLWR